MFKHLIATSAIGAVIAFAGPAAAQSSGNYRQPQNEYSGQSRQPQSQYGGQQDQQRSYAPQQQTEQRQQGQRSRAAELSMDTESALMARGYDVGPVDGNIDAKSRAGIRAYQRDAGLEANGQASVQLLAHIESNNIKAGGARPADSVGAAAGQAVDQLLKRR